MLIASRLNANVSTEPMKNAVRYCQRSSLNLYLPLSSGSNSH
jgi:hypothetical protein